MKADENKKFSQKTVEPIAIVGMSCRFPFASTLTEFWELLSQGKETITEMPSDRWNATDYYDPDLEAERKTNQRHASFLKNIHDFDPLFFNISPAEATEMNPSQKLMLELVWEAIENSSMPYDRVQGRKVGVYVGNIWNDFEHMRKHKNAVVTSHSAVGQSSNIIANRVSFTYGFTGPSLVVDTGCSSSLVALHLACQSLWDKSTEMSVVGGINHILDPDQYVLLSKFGGLSSKGRCSTFDKDGDGFVRGEGAGILILKKLSDAERDGDKVYALIRGTAMNNNGYNANLPATSVEGQKQVLHDAYLSSGILPQDVHYVEAHGTGTKLGDPTETKALGEFFREGREENLHIGSVKTNIGHLEAAAGIAGLIKVVLSMNNRQLPPSLHFKNPNPAIAFDELKLQVQAQLNPWPTKNGETLKAGINSFGWGGTNAHTVLEEYISSSGHSSEVNHTGMFCLPLSAKSDTALRDYAKLYAQQIKNSTDEEFRAICVRTSILKPALDHRILFTGKDKNEIVHALENFIQDSDEVTSHKPLTAEAKIVLIFPGQGSQWLGMGRELFDQEPVFRQSIEDCDKAFRAYTDWSLKDQLFASAEQSRLTEIQVIQPALCAVQIGLAKLWMSWGIKPHAVVGHSMGEVAAAFISGALSLDDAARIICTRSRLMKTVSGKGGAMAVTELSLSQAEELILRFPKLSIAVNNSPKSTVLAGDQQAITEVLNELEGKGLFARQVKVDVASHSKQMDPLKAELHKELNTIRPVKNSIPIFSTVRSKEMEGETLNADYWVDNLRQTVQFASVLETLMQHGHVIFIEASPHPVLTNAVNECAEHQRKNVMSFASVYREKPEQESIYKNLGDLYSKGYAINWKTFYSTENAPEVSLPSYPFQRERYELEDHSQDVQAKKSIAGFPLLGNAISLAGDENTFYWETQLSLGAFPYMADHQVNETPVLPGAAYAEMIFEAARELSGKSAVTISRLQFMKSITLSKEEVSVVQLKVTQSEKVNSFRFYTKVIQPNGKIEWETLAEGEFKFAVKNVSAFTGSEERATSTDLPAATYYESLKTLGLQYGSYFQGLKTLQKIELPGMDEVHFTVAADSRIALLAGKYKIHPALLDACFQPLFYSVLEKEGMQNNRTTFLTEVGEIQLLSEADPNETLFGVARLHPLKKDEQRGFLSVEADITIYKQDNTPLLEVKALKGKVIDTTLTEQRKEKLKNWLYKINWMKVENMLSLPANELKETWVVLGDPYGVSDILVDKMLHRNYETIHVTPANGFSQSAPNRYTINYGREEDYNKLIQTVFSQPDKKITGIIHIGSMCYTWQDPYLTADIVEQQQVYGSISFMFLHQQLTALKLSETPRLVIVTNGIQHTSHEQDAVQPVHSPLWGMAKVMFNELTQYNCRYFDLSANPSMEELDQIIYQLRDTKTSEHEIALRGTNQFVPRLGVHIDTDKRLAEPREFSSTGTYLVTGFRGLGFVFIEWMIRQGARNFALVSRSGDAPEELMERIKILETQGCKFRIFRADAGYYNEIKAVVDDIDHSMPQLKGVIHAAGVIEARTLTELNQTEFLRILNPKVKGAWNLHLLTQEKALDCFILFSSASTLIGLSGQGSYVAANAFLDTLAYSRRRMGLPGMSINWGVMKDVGMVANKAELEKYARAEGFEPVSMHDAMDVFHAIYDSEHTQIGIVKLHPETMANYYSALSQTPYFKGLLAKENPVVQQESSYLDRLAALTSTEERILLLEELVTQLVSKIVKTPSARIKSSMTFKGLGIDSLMAIQLRNLLEKNINLKLSVAMFWSHPTIHEYATFLGNSLAEQLLIKTMQDQVVQIKEANPANWFVIQKPNENASHRLFCFHDAGGNSSLYHSWPDALGREVEVVSIELPGRGRRMNEKPYTDLKQLIHDLKPVLLPLLDKPFLFFGHSMGGLIAFEVARDLRRSNLAQPQKLFISSTPGLTTYTRQEVDHTLSDEALIELFPHLDKNTIADDELHQLLVGLIRTDLQLLNNYKYEKVPPLTIPLIVLHGDNDERVTAEKAEKWCEETRESCQVICRPGGHRYIEHDGEFLTSLVLHEIAMPVTVKRFIKGGL
jgi:acyl transferase domain-containing protein/surfactin synthase thioesterase subunit/acyl carrier protein